MQIRTAQLQFHSSTVRLLLTILYMHLVRTLSESKHESILADVKTFEFSCSSARAQAVTLWKGCLNWVAHPSELDKNLLTEISMLLFPISSFWHVLWFNVRNSLSNSLWDQSSPHIYYFHCLTLIPGFIQFKITGSWNVKYSVQSALIFTGSSRHVSVPATLSTVWFTACNTPHAKDRSKGSTSKHRSETAKLEAIYPGKPIYILLMH